jgi:hypothetical protein
VEILSNLGSQFDVNYREVSTEREESIQINCLKKRGLKTSHIHYSYNKIGVNINIH